MKRLALFVFGIVFLSTSRGETAAGFTPGSFRVTETGAAEYRIPIQVPPGLAGLEPKLALVYNSQAGNGLLGVGWTLEGLSSITRCPRTVAQDGVRGGINYDLNDRFCLDGQRLVAISGNYGADGTEYRTERESFSKVMSYGAAGNGPAWFRVWTKRGQILEYGNTVDSRIEAQGKPTVRVWALNKVSDSKGNYFGVSYTEDNANGDFYPGRIDYAGNGAQSPGDAVQFLYESRIDAVPSYAAGSLSKTLNRLAGVKTYVGASVVKDYRLTYDNNGVVGRSRLTGLAECDRAGLCLPSTNLAWQNGGAGFAVPDFNNPALPYPGGYNNANTDGSYMVLGDFNGDGKTDYMWRPQNGDGRWLIAYSTGSGFSMPDYNSPALPSALPTGQSTSHSNGIYMKTGDFNGDGKTDYMWIPDGTSQWLVAYSTGAGFTVPDFNNPALPSPLPGGYNNAHTQGIYMQLGDFNGDGKTDYMWIPDGTSQWFIAYSTGTGFTIPDFNNPALPSPLPGGYNNAHTQGMYMKLGDFNGDGKTDYMWIPDGTSQWFIAYSTGTGFTIPDFNNPALPSPLPGGHNNAHTQGMYMQLGDFNGDGKTDYMWIPDGTSQWFIAYSTGTGFTIPDFNNPALPSPLPGGYNNAHTQGMYMQLGDFNGDGKTDYMWIPDGTSRWFIAYSTGTGFTIPDFNNPALPSPLPGGYNNAHTQGIYMKLGDFNGDGKTDYMWIPDGTSQWFVALANTPMSSPDALASVTTGSGTQTAITYKPMTDTTVHNRDATSIYPVLDRPIPQYVVSSSSQANAAGGSIVTDYFYSGGKFHQSGLATLGFRRIEGVDAQTGVRTATGFRQDYPFQGLPVSVVKTNLSGAVLSQVVNTWSDNPVPNTIGYDFATGKYHRSDLGRSVDSGHDLNGIALPVATTTTSYDALGNAASVVVSTDDGNSKTTKNVYADDPAAWRLGRLMRSTVQSSAP